MSWGSSLKIPEVRQNPQGNPVSFRNFPSSEEFCSGDSGFLLPFSWRNLFSGKIIPKRKLKMRGIIPKWPCNISYFQVFSGEGIIMKFRQIALKEYHGVSVFSDRLT